MKAVRIILFVFTIAQMSVGFHQVGIASDGDQANVAKRKTLQSSEHNKDHNKQHNVFKFSAGEEKPWLGVGIATINNELREKHSLSHNSGVYVESVLENSPAEEFGLEVGDLILEFDGRKLTSADELIDLVASNEAGAEVILLLSRDGRKIKEVVTLGSWQGSAMKEFESQELSSDSDLRWREFGSSSYLGVSVETLDGQLAEYFGVRDGSAVLITDVTEDSPAETAGLKAGDVVIEIDGNQMESVSDIQEEISSADSGDKVTLTLLRDRKQREITATVAERENQSHSLNRIKEFRFDSNNKSDDVMWFDGHSSHGNHKDINIVPRLRGMMRGHGDSDMLFLDLQEGSDEMKNLKKRMKKLERQLAELKEKLSEQ